MKLWSKGYTVTPLIEHYTAANNASIDAHLARHDIWGSLAHARVLQHANLLTPAEAAAIHTGLCLLLTAAEQGELAPQTDQEDIHTVIEQQLIASLGETGKKIHTGRSRNDQVLVDLRLYVKEALLALATTVLDTAATLVTLAQHYEWTPLPGYTHMQRGMLSSVGLWAAAHAEALLDDCTMLTAAYCLNDQSPLGSGAAYGSPLPLDRTLAAALLGFAQPQHNVLAAANARGKYEAAVVQALALVMLDLSKFAQDVLLFTTSEYNFFHVPEELCDGSSMMPQKRNLGALEVVRARAHTVISLQSQMLATLAGLPSGYNMDYQETKEPLMTAIRITQESLQVAKLFAGNISINTAAMQAACTAEIFATDRTYELVRAGVPFRDAYVQVAAQPASAVAGDLTARLHARTAIGTSGNLELPALATAIAAERAEWVQRQVQFVQTITALVEGRDDFLVVPPHQEPATLYSTKFPTNYSPALAFAVATGI